MIAVHAGVSFDASSSLSDVCVAAAKSGHTVVDCVSFLEDDAQLNCGCGSNLNWEGEVECDAAFMTAERHRYGAIGCVSRIKNPSQAAKLIALHNGCPGLLRPQVLVGIGAETWALNAGCEEINPSELVTDTARMNFLKAKKKIESDVHIISNEAGDRLDTVGAVMITENESDIEACTSSGGISLKTPGRLSHCTQYGASVWAERIESELGSRCITVSVSGCGEAISSVDFARSIARAVLNRSEDVTPVEICSKWFQDAFLSNCLLESIPIHYRLAGALILYKESGSHELIVVHNTPYFPVAYKRLDTGRVKRISSVLSLGSNFKCEAFNL